MAVAEGETAMETKIGAVTVKVTLAVCPLLVAVIVTVPGVTPVTTPVGEIVAIAKFRLAHSVPGSVVKSAVVLLE